MAKTKRDNVGPSPNKELVKKKEKPLIAQMDAVLKRCYCANSPEKSIAIMTLRQIIENDSRDGDTFKSLVLATDVASQLMVKRVVEALKANLIELDRSVAQEAIKTLEGMFRRADYLSRFLMAHVDEILLELLVNIKAKRVIVQSRDLFLAFKAVYTSESLAEKLLNIIKTESDKIEKEDVIGLLVQLLKMTGRGFKLLRPSLNLLIWVEEQNEVRTSEMKQNIAALSAQLSKVLE